MLLADRERRGSGIRGSSYTINDDEDYHYDNDQEGDNQDGNGYKDYNNYDNYEQYDGDDDDRHRDITTMMVITARTVMTIDAARKNYETQSSTGRLFQVGRSQPEKSFFFINRPPFSGR